MRCWTAVPLLERYLDGRLEPARTREIADHLASCVKCSRRLAGARSVIDALSTFPPARAPAGFRQRVMSEVHRFSLRGQPAAVAEAEQQSWQRGRFYRRLGLSFVVSAALLGASLVVPRASYPTILPGRVVEADLSTGPASMVRTTLAGAGRVVRGTLESGRPAASANGGEAK